MLRHLCMTHWQVRRRFPPASLHAIAAAIQTAEARHQGEIACVIEGALPGAALLKGLSARERALEVFAQQRVWDTEHNNGVLIYLLLADRRVEIVADRGIHAKVGTEGWEPVCREMEAAFREGKFEEGVKEGVRAVAEAMLHHYPASGRARNELPDEPVVL